MSRSFDNKLFAVDGLSELTYLRVSLSKETSPDMLTSLCNLKYLSITRLAHFHPQPLVISRSAELTRLVIEDHVVSYS